MDFHLHDHLPKPPSPRRAAYAALALLAAGLVLLGAALAGLFGDGSRAAASVPPPPPVTLAVTVPPAAAPETSTQPTPAPVKPAARKRNLDLERFAANNRRHVRASWVAGFYPLYEIAARTYRVPWLLIASVHKQETAFSTHPTTYRGLNFAGCCGGPMQFNVTNGPVSTWDRFKGSYKRAPRPAAYNHRTAEHPSLYDDFDTIMAAAALLQANGATEALDVNAWRAAYLYYGPDLTGVGYGDQVLARAIHWGRNGFCINCETDPAILAAVTAAWGDPVRAEYAAAAAADERRPRKQGKGSGST